MRGSDIEYNPVFFAYLIVTMDSIYMFVNQAKLPSNYTEHFEANQVKIELLNYDGIRDKLSGLVSMTSTKNIVYHFKAVHKLSNARAGGRSLRFQENSDFLFENQ